MSGLRENGLKRGKHKCTSGGFHCRRGRAALFLDAVPESWTQALQGLDDWYTDLLHTTYKLGSIFYSSVSHDGLKAMI